MISPFLEAIGELARYEMIEESKIYLTHGHYFDRIQMDLTNLFP